MQVLFAFEALPSRDANLVCFLSCGDSTNILFAEMAPILSRCGQIRNSYLLIGILAKLSYFFNLIYNSELLSKLNAMQGANPDFNL